MVEAPTPLLGGGGGDCDIFIWQRWLCLLAGMAYALFGGGAGGDFCHRRWQQHLCLAVIAAALVDGGDSLYIVWRRQWWRYFRSAIDDDF